MSPESDIKLEGCLEIVFNMESHSQRVIVFCFCFFNNLSLLLIISKDFNQLQ